ncbi:YcxB family protein [Actinomadura sp. 3N508]|uniref:YcxB family protein n=1 Tax=Actinomadura sp. 3N508 TaxID=3375153 RepID=UPI0037B2DEB4
MDIGDNGFTVGYEPTPDEAVRVFARGLRGQLMVTYVALVVLLTGGAGLCFYVGKTWLGIALLISAVAAPIAADWAVRQRLREALAHMCVPTTMRLTADEYESRTEQATIKYRWSMFSKVVNTKDYWMLYVDGQPAAFLPKGAFDAGQLAQIEGFLATREQAKTR